MARETFHGTLNGYNHHHCRCDECSAARRAYRKRTAADAAGLPGHLSVTCWCEIDVVQVPEEDVRACRTRSCGRPKCSERRMLTLDVNENNPLPPIEHLVDPVRIRPKRDVA